MDGLTFESIGLTGWIAWWVALWVMPLLRLRRLIFEKRFLFVFRFLFFVKLILFFQILLLAATPIYYYLQN